MSVQYLQLVDKETGVPVKVVPLLGARDSYEAERMCYCPCATPGGHCWLMESHNLSNQDCDRRDGQNDTDN